VRIEDLTDKQLDYFCAIAKGWKKLYEEEWHSLENGYELDCENYRPTTDAEQCMDIQECEKISVIFVRNNVLATIERDDKKCENAIGTTAKRAIIACFVKSELGEEVDCETV